MAYIHVNVGDELHRLVKATAATRGESIKAALTRMCWWYVDGTDQLMLDAVELALSDAKAEWAAVDNHPAASEREDVEFYANVLERAKMRMADAAEEEG